jgi:hypothetical protein
MYRVIGTDGQQYGPISAEQLGRWIAENRLNARSLVQPEGSQDWKALGSFPEFADALKTTSPAPPPRLGGSPPKPDADALAAEILARDYDVDIGRCLSRSWDLLTRHFWLIVGASFVVGLIQSAVGLLAGVCTGGLYLLLLKLIRREPAQFGDAFAGFSLAFLQLFLAGLIAGILASIGFLFCLLPGIYLAVAWIFALPLVIDKNLDFWPAMELSRKVITRHWWLFFGFALVNFLVMLLGLAVCIVGVFVAQPVVLGALAYAYEDIFGGQRASAQPSAPVAKPGLT